jgi:hypothetical protein
VKLDAKWYKKALCASDPQSARWLSSDVPDIQYAISVCRKCPVSKECFVHSWNSDDGEWHGVRAGISKYHYLNSTWRRVETDSESNWVRDDSVFQRLLREA